MAARQDAQKRRAAARDERRAGAESRGGGDQEQETSNGQAESDGLDAGEALRRAAAAGIAGAAIGAMRMLAERRSDGLGDEEPQSSAVEEEDEEEDLPADSDEEPPEDEDRGDEGEDQGAPPEPDPEPRAGAERHRRGPAPPKEGSDRSEVGRIVDSARDQLRDLLESEPERVSGVERTASGWSVALEVLEVRRIPESTDLLATYELDLDADGRLIRFDRVRRYHRAQADARDYS